MTAFLFNDPPALGGIDEERGQVTVYVPYNTDLTQLSASYITTGISVSVASITQENGISVNDFSLPVIYRVLAEDGSYVDYTVTVNRLPSSAKGITEFSVVDPLSTGIIDEVHKTIHVTVPYGSSRSCLKAHFVATGESVYLDGIEQQSGVTENDFTQVRYYRVFASDGSSEFYTVRVDEALSPAKEITSFSILGIAGTIDEEDHTIIVYVPSATDRTTLVATYATTGKQVRVEGVLQASGVTVNDFSSDVIYQVTAADNSSVPYTVKVLCYSCSDSVKNGDETDVDCGGTCSACSDGKTCGRSQDCTSKVCTSNVCRAATCSDGVSNGSETDVDCGGGMCNRCSDSKRCSVSSDCTSSVCTGAICRSATCSDGVKNGLETDVDCGGMCSRCPAGKRCSVSSDCASYVCTGGICMTETCTDTVQNGTETDVDCGGSTCTKCALSKKCSQNSDCVTGICTTNRCVNP